MISDVTLKSGDGLQDDANAFKYYPVISVGVSFRF